MRLRSAIVLGCATTLGACSAFLDFDLDGNPDLEPGETGTESDATDGAVDTGITTDAAADVDVDIGETGPPDAGPDAQSPLDCRGTLLCDGFENKASPSAKPLVGTWNASTNAQGSVMLDTSQAARGASSVRFTSPATTTTGGFNILGANNLAFSSTGAPAAVVARVSVDVLLDWNPASYPAATERNLIGIRPSSTLGEPDLELAGLAILGDEVRATLRSYTGGLPTDTSVLIASDLRNAWHRITMEARFSTNTDGYLKVSVDGKAQTSITGRQTWAGQTQRTFVVWIGANATPSSPALPSARYDNIEVRSP